MKWSWNIYTYIYIYPCPDTFCLSAITHRHTHTHKNVHTYACARAHTDRQTQTHLSCLIKVPIAFMSQKTTTQSNFLCAQELSCLKKNVLSLYRQSWSTTVLGQEKITLFFSSFFYNPSGYGIFRKYTHAVTSVSEK